jgi:hypothetical protein
MLTDRELDAMRERCKAATDGPWHTDYHDTTRKRSVSIMALSGKRVCDWDLHGASEPPHPLDREFIAHARTDMARLLDEVDRLRDVAPSPGQAEKGISGKRVCDWDLHARWQKP